MSYTNFKDDILEAVNGEEIEAVIILSKISGSWKETQDKRDKDIVLDKTLSWAEAAPLLDYKYDSGYGGIDCHNIEVFTKKYVFYVHEYDGSTQLMCVNRNPL